MLEPFEFRNYEEKKIKIRTILPSTRDRLLPLWCLRQSFRLTGGSVVRIYTAFLTSARVSDPVRYLPDPNSEPTSQKKTGVGIHYLF